jgi:glycosyltransferase involved in cell wall biosynthesis
MLEDLRQELGLADDVRFLGALSFSDVLEEYRAADIFVLPCLVARDGARDVTPNCVLEAMAMKLPVVTTTVAAIPELVEHEVSGYLVEPNSDEALAGRLDELISSAGKRRRLGEAGRSRVEQTFDIRHTASRFIEVFSEIRAPREKLQIELV